MGRVGIVGMVWWPWAALFRTGDDVCVHRCDVVLMCHIDVDECFTIILFCIFEDNVKHILLFSGIIEMKIAELIHESEEIAAMLVRREEEALRKQGSWDTDMTRSITDFE